jgi:methionine-S-sulfoxide reductase
VAVLAGGCFWGMQDILRKIPGVLETEVGYTGGWLQNPRYEDTHDSRSGHAEAVRVVFDPRLLPYEVLLEQWFFRMHDPTTKDRQGNDVGTQYRSVVFTHGPEQRAAAEASRKAYAAALAGAGHPPITTEIRDAPEFFYAEGYHQQYLSKNPDGYCGLGGTGVACPAPA